MNAECSKSRLRVNDLSWLLSVELAAQTDLDQSDNIDSLRDCSDITPHEMIPKGQPSMSELNTYSGLAAISICEALLLALNDAKVLPEHEIMGILKDAAQTHEKTGTSGVELETHLAVAALINRIIEGGNSVRRP
jgi:hypothetical protein